MTQNLNFEATAAGSFASSLYATRSALLVFGLALAFTALGSTAIASASWSVRLEPMHTTVRGHDQHVLTIHEVDGAAQTDAQTAVHFETDTSIAWRGGLAYESETWRWGADFLWLSSSQGIPDRSATSSGGGQELRFEIPDRIHTSTGPGENLYFRVLEDNDLIIYKVDFHGERTLVESDDSSLRLRIGVTFADFDNDYRVAVGVDEVGGTRIDASSNYGWMPGPMIGLSGDVSLGRGTLEARLSQAVVFGDPDLTTMAREFTGPFSEEVVFTAEKSLAAKRDIAIPISEFEIRWSHPLTDHLTLGAGVNAMVWKDVSVPPGVIPVPGGDQTLHENTIAIVGLFATGEFSF